jgi:hypothetical protein
MVAYLAGNLAQDQPIIIVADPLHQTEWTISMRTHLRFAGLDGPIYLIPAYSETGPQVEAVTTNLIDGYFANLTDLETLQPTEIGAIVAFKAPNSLTKVPAWFNPVEWRILTFAHPYCSFSFEALACVKVGDYEHTILIPNVKQNSLYHHQLSAGYRRGPIAYPSNCQTTIYPSFHPGCNPLE